MDGSSSFLSGLMPGNLQHIETKVSADMILAMWLMTTELQCRRYRTHMLAKLHQGVDKKAKKRTFSCNNRDLYPRGTVQVQISQFTG